MGPYRAGLIFSAILALHQTAEADFNITNFAVERVESPNTTILVDNKGKNSKEKTLPINNRKNKKNFDLAFHRRLENHFPDWEGRMNYQKRQEQFYKSAMKKQAEIRRTRMIDRRSRYTRDELDAMAYFQGTGFYAKQQDSKMKPNIYDTRQTFLLKMHDETARTEFLKSFNRLEI